MSEIDNEKLLDGELFARMAEGAARQLRMNAKEVNELNVFPVPDGDTGDNMLMTIESGVRALESMNSSDLAEVMNVLSRGMLLGARGNSGVILSQFFSGMAKKMVGMEKADAAMIGDALQSGVKQAYASVVTPTEGTILTVAREAVDYAVGRLSETSTIRSLFGDLVKEMYASLQRTPEILAVLKEAGVIDSGGAGLFYIMDGCNRVLNGETFSVSTAEARPAPQPAGPGVAALSKFGPDSILEFGYCTEFLLQLQNSKVDIASFRMDGILAFLKSIGNSIVAFQDGSIVKVHVHTFSPGKVLEFCRQYGEFLTIKIENMSIQHSETTVEEPEAEPEKQNGVVAVCSGSGVADVFREFGADEIVEGGQTKNPSPNDFIAAFRRIHARHIFVFPNNGNISMAANQAAKLYTDAEVHVIESRDVGAGYVALSSMDLSSEDPAQLTATAAEAMANVTTGFVSPAIRDVELNGIRVSEGDFIGFRGKELLVSNRSLTKAFEGLLSRLMQDSGASMITVFFGADAPAEARAAAETAIKEAYPRAEAYFIDGGQEVYPFIITVE